MNYKNVSAMGSVWSADILLSEAPCDFLINSLKISIYLHDVRHLFEVDTGRKNRMPIKCQYCPWISVYERKEEEKEIIIFFYSKTNQMHNISNLFYFGTTLHMFRTVFPSIIRSLWLYIQHQVYVIQVSWLFASKQLQNLYGMMLYVQS